MITIKHNFDEPKFMWLWEKYVKAGNLEKHCTACLKGPYSAFTEPYNDHYYKCRIYHWMVVLLLSWLY